MAEAPAVGLGAGPCAPQPRLSSLALAGAQLRAIMVAPVASLRTKGALWRKFKVRWVQALSNTHMAPSACQATSTAPAPAARPAKAVLTSAIDHRDKYCKDKGLSKATAAAISKMLSAVPSQATR